MDQQDTTTNDTDAEWPELSAHSSPARTPARTITLDTQRASSDGRILEITARLDEIRTRLSSLEEHLFDGAGSDATSGDLHLRLSGLDTEIANTMSQFESLASRVAAAEENVSTTMMRSLDGFDSRVALVEDARTAQSNELGQLTSYLEQAFLRITELAEAIEEERFSNQASQGQLNDQSAQLAHDVNARIDAVCETVDTLTERFDGAAASIDASNSDVQEAIVASLAMLESRVDASENRLGRLDELSTAMEFLASRTHSLETQQHETSPDQPTRADVEELSGRIEAHAHETAAVVETAERHRSEIIAHVDHAHARSRADAESTRSAVDEALNSSAHAHQLASDASDRIGNIAETTELIGHRVDVVQAATEELHDRFETVRAAVESSSNHAGELDETVEGLSTRLDNAAIGLDAAHTRIDGTEAAAQSAHTRIDEIAAVAHSADNRINETEAITRARIDQVEQHARSTDTRVGEIAAVAHSADNRIGETEATAQSAHTRIDETEATAQSAHTRIDETEAVTRARIDQVEQHARSADTRIEEIASVAQSAHVRVDETTESLNELISDANRNLDERFMESVGHVDERLNDTVRTVNERLDSTVQDLHDRLDESASVVPTVMTSLEALSERTDSLETHVGEMDQRFSGVDDGFAGVDQHLAELDGQVHVVRQESSRIAGRSDELSARIDRAIADVEQAAGTTTEIAARVEVTEGRISAAEDRLSQTQQDVDEKLASTAETASRALDRTDELDQRITASAEEHSKALKEHLLGRIEEARAQLQQALDQSNASSSDARTTLRETVLDRLDAVEDSVERRMSSIEQDRGDDERLQSIESRLEQTDTTAQEAYAYADSLRLLQTDIVRTLQEELRNHDHRLDLFDDQIGTVQAARGDHASAERVHMLEAKLVEALQTVSQLTQIQRRNTTVEAQLTDTLAATSHGVESTQLSVATLRSDLEAAQERIAQLELHLSAAQSPPIAPAGLATQPTPAFEDHSGPAVFELTEKDFQGSLTSATVGSDNEDTGWFTESYARISDEPTAS